VIKVRSSLYSISLYFGIWDGLLSSGKPREGGGGRGRKERGERRVKKRGDQREQRTKERERDTELTRLLFCFIRFGNTVYKGKHARSIWRRHLCDKHGIPLSDQPRRTRWDKSESLLVLLISRWEEWRADQLGWVVWFGFGVDEGRPKTDEERRERSLESKRKWASKKRFVSSSFLLFALSLSLRS